MQKLTPEQLKLLRLSAPAILSLLRNQEARVLSRLYGEYRNGTKDLQPIIAEYAVIREQISTLTQQLEGDS